MSLRADDTICGERMSFSANKLDSVMVNKYLPFGGFDVWANTQLVAFGAYKSMREKVREIPFPRGPASMMTW